MNQILSMGGEPQKPIKENKEIINPIINERPTKQIQAIERANMNSNKADLSKVIRIFCIIIILFGLALIGTSTYALISNKEKLVDNIEVSADQMGKETKITIQSDHPIKKFTYKWNTGEPFVLEGDGTVTFETIIQIPNGNNILRMTVTDYYGSEKNFYEQYIYDSEDSKKPEIQTAINGTKLNIKATDDTEMSYITYSWNDEEAKRIEVGNNNKKEINEDIEVPEGHNKLTIVAADKEGNRETITKNVIGDTKPNFTLSKDGLNLILSASDDQGLGKISITIDGNTIDSGEQMLNLKEATTTIPVTSGTHEITVTVTNINGLTATETVNAEF